MSTRRTEPDHGLIMGESFYDRYGGQAGNSSPKYIQLSEAILSAINNGHWKPGAQLPGEMEMARSTGFSLGTAQKALRVVAEQGVIERRHGQGTFVAKMIAGPWHFRFTSATKGSFLALSSKIIGRKMAKPNEPWAALLCPDDGQVIRIDRIIRIGQKAAVHNVFYISRRRYPAFWEKPLEELNSANLKTILRQEYGVSITRASNFIRMVALPSIRRSALHLRNGSQGILLETIASSGSKKAIYCSDLYLPPDTPRLFVSEKPNPPDFWP